MSRRAFGSVRKLPSGRWQARYTGPDLAEHTAPGTFLTKRAAEGWLGAEDRLASSGGWTPPRLRHLAATSTTTGPTVTLHRQVHLRRLGAVDYGGLALVDDVLPSM